MKPLTMDEMRELRADIAHLGFSEEKIDEYIRLIDFCAISLVDHFHSVSSVKISLQKLENYSFDQQGPRATLPKSKSSEPVDLDTEGAINTPTTKRLREP